MTGLFIRALLIVLLAGVLGAGHLMLRDTPIVLTRQSPASSDGPADSGDPIPANNGQQGSVDPLDAPVKAGSITLREALALHEGGAMFIDARPEDEFGTGRIAGAVWMPAERVGTDDALMELGPLMDDPTIPIVIYCQGGECDASENAAIRLESLGFGWTIHILGVGYEDWADAGLAIE